MNRSPVTALAALALCAAAAAAQRPAPTRLILVVGDGMGLPHWSAARLSSPDPLALESLPVIGLVDTRCACDRTTDSGAAATALATGQRSQYRFIGMTADSTPQTSVLEAAEARGLATGMVTTTHITDATPAAFGADVPTRYDREAIAAQYAAKDIEVLLGGGRAFFSRRRDGRDLAAEMGSRYTVVRTPAEFRAVEPARTPRLLGLFADSTIYPDAASLRPTLPDMATAALAIVGQDPDGFFLLLESEDTDDLFHDSVRLGETLSALAELDRTIAVALAYQARHPETLIVVLGDHETGGLAIQVERDGTASAQYTTREHSAESVPLFAGGPGAGRFGRWLRNEEVGRLLLEFVRGAPE